MSEPLHSQGVTVIHICSDRLGQCHPISHRPPLNESSIITQLDILCQDVR